METDAIYFNRGIHLKYYSMTGKEEKNPAYGRHQLSQTMRIVGQIQI